MSKIKINFLTLFPKYYESFINESITKKAIDNKILEVRVIDIRDYSTNKHNKVDDIIYGGGTGMLLMVEPIDLALQQVSGKKILLTPQGSVFTQSKAKELSKEIELTFIAGRYEGFDERVRSLVDEELSIGDYVLTGGEYPSLVIADAVVRLVQGVIPMEAHLNDSHQNNLLEAPQYTKPREYKGMKVPEVLLNGNHKKIDEWRKEKALKKTKDRRPEILERNNYEK